MAKRMLSAANSNTQRQSKKEVRKVLLSIQPSDNLEENNMADNKMLPSKEKQTKTKKVKETEKENITARRSKRKAAVTSQVNYIDSPDITETTKSRTRNVAKPKKSAKPKESSAAVRKTEQPTKSNQTKLNFSPVASNTTKEIEKPDVFALANPKKPNISTEDSGFDSGPSSVVSNLDPINSTLVFNSPDVRNSIVPAEISIITGGELTLSYWKDLAEQRRIALFKALNENEELYDQLTVLESENLQLKNLLKDAEHLLEVLKDVVE